MAPAGGVSRAGEGDASDGNIEATAVSVWWVLSPSCPPRLQRGHPLRRSRARRDGFRLWRPFGCVARIEHGVERVSAGNGNSGASLHAAEVCKTVFGLGFCRT